MIGAIVGDVVGSRFEFNNHKSKEFELFSPECFVTDDSIMTVAVMRAITMAKKGDYADLRKKTIRYMQKYGQRYPDAGYGRRFANWIWSKDPKPYYSYGNGAAMRVKGLQLLRSASGWRCTVIAKTISALMCQDATISTLRSMRSEMNSAFMSLVRRQFLKQS